VADAIAPMQALLRELAESFRRLWLKGRKPEGLEVVQIRLAGLDARYAELQRRLGELADQPDQWLGELDEPVPGRHGYAQYHRLATASGHL